MHTFFVVIIILSVVDYSFCYIVFRVSIRLHLLPIVLEMINTILVIIIIILLVYH